METRARRSHAWSLICHSCGSGNEPTGDIDIVNQSCPVWYGTRPAKVVCDIRVRKSSSTVGGYRDLKKPDQMFDTELVKSAINLMAHGACGENAHVNRDNDIFVSSCLTSDLDLDRTVSSHVHTHLPQSVQRILGIAYHNLHYVTFEILTQSRIVIIYDGLGMPIGRWNGVLKYHLEKYGLDLDPDIFIFPNIKNALQVFRLLNCEQQQWCVMTAKTFNNIADIIQSRSSIVTRSPFHTLRSLLPHAIQRPIVKQYDVVSCGPIAIQCLQFLMGWYVSSDRTLTIGVNRGNMQEIRLEILRFYRQMFHDARSKNQITQKYRLAEPSDGSIHELVH